jgi:hypothetical protein
MKVRVQMATVWLPLCFFGLATADRVSAGPRIACAESVFDFGERPETDTVEHVFTLRSEGDRPLEILEVRVTCGCTTGRVSERILNPGGEAQVQATFKLKGRSGPQRQRLHVRSNDPEHREMILTLIGRVQSDLSFKPPMVFFGQLVPESRQSRFADLAVQSNRSVRVLQVSCPAPWVEATREDAPGGAERIRLRTRPPLPLGLLHTTVEIRTDAPDFPVLRLPVGAYVRFSPKEGEGPPRP